MKSGEMVEGGAFVKDSLKPLGNEVSKSLKLRQRACFLEVHENKMWQRVCLSLRSEQKAAGQKADLLDVFARTLRL